MVPAIKTTLEMIDGVEATAQRGRDTLILKHEGMEVSAHTTGKMFVTTTTRETVLARLPFTAPPRNTPPIGREDSPPPRTRSLSPMRVTRRLHPDFLRGQRGREGRGRGDDQMLTITRSRAN